MAYSPYRKGTILAPVGGTNHLHIICNDPAYDAVNGCECVLVVNITTVYPNAPHDPACILHAGDHPFVKHDSYVYYADAIIWKIPNVVARKQSGELIQHADMDDRVFQRVLAGFETSDFTSGKVLKFYRKNC
ncbi:hypothetical protein CYR32_01700 [Chimaeribacter coloradensis]|uniref:Uncharacterized protein n=1 Tax=Chimaeribacter coloradensis TaxID=2060068 RepID=A0A2N5ED77_9GAMM|nr:hypothetical protein [Chimaeribacter coloradensis]PLR40483.1 hypothetical protein CYR32_01700 [Chimaeribacter coloradensis]